MKKQEKWQCNILSSPVGFPVTFVAVTRHGSLPWNQKCLSDSNVHQTGFWLPTVMAHNEIRNICQTLAFIKQVFGCPLSWRMMKSEISVRLWRSSNRFLAAHCHGTWWNQKCLSDSGVHQTGFWLPTVMAHDETRNVCQTLAFTKQVFGCHCHGTWWGRTLCNNTYLITVISQQPF